MNKKSKIIRKTIELTQSEGIQSNGINKSKIIRRILVSGIFSLLLLSVIIYTLPMTVLTVSSLLEYAIIVTLVIFLLILLIRYFGILILAYLYLNEYTFKKTDHFRAASVSGFHYGVFGSFRPTRRSCPDYTRDQCDPRGAGKSARRTRSG